MKVLGIDAGFATTGWSIIEKDGFSKNGMKLVDYGVILTDSKTPFGERLLQLFNDLCSIIDQHNPDHMAVESIFFFKNQKTVINVSQARGVILLAGKIKNKATFDYTPLQVKTSVTGYGRAEKKQVQKMIQMIFGLKEVPKPDDAADAVAIAVCHISSYRSSNLTTKS